jgi:hypothetical protein
MCRQLLKTDDGAACGVTHLFALPAQKTRHFRALQKVATPEKDSGEFGC